MLRGSGRVLRWSGYAALGALPPTYAWYVHASGDYFLEGARRGVYFWARVGPIVLHYVWTDRTTRNADDATRGASFERLHAQYAPTALSVILALRGFYVKVGQFGSSRADILPPAYLQQFRLLQDQVPHEDIGHVRATIEACLGQPSDMIFTHMESEPLGAASIGQVHRARLRDSGTEVVVKVQYPSVRRTFHSDMSCIRSVVTLAEPSLALVFDELQKQFLTEFDYRREVRNLQDVARLILPEWEGSVTLPEPLPEHCGELVLTMTYLPGEKLETALRREWERLGFREEDLQARLNVGLPRNAAILALGLRLLRWRVALQDLWTALRARAQKLCEALGWPSSGATAVARPRIPDRHQLLRTLLGVHAQQVLQHGVFNADLHPGNFLLLPDGRLGLIDFGQVKRIGAETRRQLAELLVALAHGNCEDTVSAMTDLGVRSKKMDPRFLEANARLLFGRIDGDLTGGRSLLEFVQDLRTWDTLVVMPGELYLPSRAAMMLRGLAMLLHCHVSIADEWRPVAERVLVEGNT